MKWASAISTRKDTESALDECVDLLAKGLEGPVDLSLLFLSPHHAERFDEIPELLAARMSCGFVFGSTASGIIGAGREVEDAPAISLTAARLPGVGIHSCHVEGETLARDEFMPDLPLGATPSFLVLADPYSSPIEPFVRGLDEAFPGATQIGGLASGAEAPGGNAIFLGDSVHRSGTSVLALTGNIRVDAVVAQGCRPIGEPMFVTRAKQNLVLELDERPPMEVLQELYERLEEEDQVLFRSSLFLGIGMEGGKEAYRQGDFLIRNLLGIDRASGALAVGAMSEEHAVVQFHLRDAKTSASDLRSLLARHQMETPTAAAAGLLFTCCGRGQGLYGVPDHDAGLFAEYFPGVPLGGFFANGEIGPVRGSTFVHGYTSSFGIIRTAERTRSEE